MITALAGFILGVTAGVVLERRRPGGHSDTRRQLIAAHRQNVRLIEGPRR